ncbi:MAG: response regulator transcription factor [Flavisolibacter sp.]|nr:response regulator transcription factor [Flavisolibacter sp.]
MIISCIIIDDEPIARKGVESYIQKVDFLNLVGSYSSPQRIETTVLLGVDLIFLDIRLHKTNGLEFYKNLKPNAPFVVVISAYSEYALEGFELNVADYLLKPVSFERFLSAASRVKDLIELKQNSQVIYDAGPGYFFIKCENKIQKVTYDEVLYMESRSNYVLIYTDTKKYLSYLSLNILVDKLPKHRFIRVHKSYIVAIDRVDAVKNDEVIAGGHSVSIGKSYKDHFMDLVESKLIKK